MPEPLDPHGLVEQLAPRIEELLARARRKGADAAEISLGIDRGLSVNVRLGEVDTLEYHHDRGLALTVYRGHAKATVNSSDLGEAALEAALDAALAIAAHTDPDPCQGLAEAELMAREIPDLDLHHPWPIEADQAIELARRCEAAAREHDPRIRNSEGATLSSHEGLHLYANSHGFLGAYPTSSHSLSCSVIAEDDSGMQRDYWYDSRRAPEELAPPEAIGREAARRAVARLGARPVPTGRFPVIFAPEVASGLIRHFTGAIRGHNLYRRTSFLVDALGESVFPPWLTIEADPLIPRAAGSRPFDAEGVAARRCTLVRQGNLQSYLLDSYSACRLGLRTTGHAGALPNLILSHGELDQAGLLKEMGRGLLVTELMGQGVNLTTGDYSRGAAGFWVEGGEIAHPVQEITIAGNLREMFAGIQAIGADVDRRRVIRTGSLWIERMTIAGEG